MCELVDSLQKRLEIQREIARDRIMATKQRSKESKERESKLRCFEERSLVLRLAPGMRGS